jgi:hypothetical protein
MKKIKHVKTNLYFYLDRTHRKPKPWLRRVLMLELNQNPQESQDRTHRKPKPWLRRVLMQELNQRNSHIKYSRFRISVKNHGTRHVLGTAMRTSAKPII